MLLNAMCTYGVLKQHLDLVVGTVRHALSQDGPNSTGAFVVLLQEVSEELRAALSEECRAQSWFCSFSDSAQVPGKCDAITCIISRHPMEDGGQVVIEENGKARRLAVARWGQTWIASCHVPHEPSKGKSIAQKVGSAPGSMQSEIGNADAGARVLASLAERFMGDGATSIVVGGDWNADVREVAQVARRLLQEGAEGADSSGLALELFAPDGATHMGVEVPIDGILVVQRAPP
mmetsp:Transcript_123401/g.242079  ORF Transcript_123401/g.242079 Transcript_123401/m.242079 type:complete len:234 (-) Transcript_123401:56-757(-)